MTKKAFTLTEVSIMLVLIGLVVVLFTRISSQSVRQGSANVRIHDIDQAMEALIGETRYRGSLPVGIAVDPPLIGGLWLSIGSRRMENRFNERYGYIKGLRQDICSANKGILTYVQCINGACRSTENVAAIIYSYPIDNASLSDNVFTWNMVGPGSSSQVRAITYPELDVAVGCPPPAIVPDVLPAISGSSRVTLKTNSGQEVIWCVEAPPNQSSNILGTVTAYNEIGGFGDRLNNTNQCDRGDGVTGSRLELELNPNTNNAPGVYSITVMIWDTELTGPNGVNRMIDRKTYGLTITE